MAERHSCVAVYINCKVNLDLTLKVHCKFNILSQTFMPHM